jgi:major membrane immunogen (membrane-anchored lipoprotein)
MIMNKFRYTFIVSAVLIAICLSSFYRGDYLNGASGRDQDTLRNYPDGNYSGQSRFKYTDEPYWGSVSFTLKNGQFAGINFFIRDSNLHEPFDGNYEKHFEGNELYIQQNRNDWKGVQAYPGKLMETQDIDKIDAISGATWSYNIFKASVKEALNKTRNRSK